MIRAVLFACSVLFPHAVVAEAFICTGDQATGFKLKNEDWRLVNFKPPSFVVSRSSGVDGFKWDVRETGNEAPGMGCEYDFNEPGYLVCGGVGDFKMNRRNLRFIYTLAFGYVNRNVAPGSGVLDDLVGITIGKCTPIGSPAP